MELGIENVKYAMRVGHFEAALKFHVSQALLCSHVFLDGNFLTEVAKAIIDHFDLLDRPALTLTATSSGGLSVASHINREFFLRERDPLAIHTESNQLLRDGVYLILLPNVLTDAQIGVLLNTFTVKGAFVAGVGAICDRRKHKGYVDDVEVWAPLDLTREGVNANLDRELCPLCIEGAPLTTGLRII